MKPIVPKFNQENWPSFPDNPRDPAAWDEFWRAILAKPDWADETERAGDDPVGALRRLNFFRFEPFVTLRMDSVDHRYRTHLETLRRLGGRRILCAGNGFSVLPHIFSHNGFEVTALDISHLATDYNRTQFVDEAYLLRFFTFGLPASDTEIPVAAPEHGGKAARMAEAARRLDQMRRIVRESHIPGGVLDFVTADLFTYEPGDNSFGAAVIQNLAEHFSESDRHLLAERLYRWLTPGGILIVESQYLSLHQPPLGVPDGIEEAFVAAGFLVHLEEVYRWQREQFTTTWWQVGKAVRLEQRGVRDQIQEEFAQRAEQQRALDLNQVRQGRKMVIFQYGR